MAAHYLVFLPFRLDLDNEQLWEGEALVPLRPKVFAVLRYLAEHAGRLVTREELRQAVWPTTVVSESVLRGMIRELRDILGDDADTARFVETIPHRGYRFLPAVTAATAPSTESRVANAPPSPAQSSVLRPQSSVVVGRERELHQLQGWWEKALSGQRHLVFVTGEPGIGKTTLLDAFLMEIRDWKLGVSAEETQDGRRQSAVSHPSGMRFRKPIPNPQPLAPVLIGRGQCIEHYGSGEAYLPVLEALGQLCRQPGGEQMLTLLKRYAPTWLVQMPALVSDTELETFQRKVQGSTRERMLREMAEALEALTVEQPLVLVLEDLHWSDYSTLDLLTLLAQRRGPARLFLLATYRPTEVIVSGHPLKALKQELQGRGQCEELALGFLTVSGIAQYLTARFSHQQFPAELAVLLHQSTEGNPLFMVTVIDEWARQGVVVETDSWWRLTVRLESLVAGVPESLRQMIEKQLERLRVEEQRLVEAASVLGREFTTAAVAAGLEEQPEQVERWCEGLEKRGQFLQARGVETLGDGTVTGRYRFLHALYPQVLYERLAVVQRVYLHRRIAAIEERVYGSHAEEHAAELAMHFEQGHDHERAVHYCYQAGQHARQRFAAAEAIRHFRHGLDLLTALPETRERRHHELSLLIALGLTLWGADPDVGRVCTRAEELAQQLSLPAQRFIALDGLVRWHFLRGELRRAQELGEQALLLTQTLNDPILQVKAAAIMAAVMVHYGALRTGQERATAVVAMYDALPSRSAFLPFGEDPKVSVLNVSALALWLLGYPEQARQQSLVALQWARELTSPFGIVLAHCFVTIIQQCLRTETTVREWAEKAVTAASEYGSQLWEGIGRVLWGWSLVMQGQQGSGWIQFQQGQALFQAFEGRAFRSYTLALVAEAEQRSQKVEAGLTAVTKALAQVEKSEERFWEAELWRLKGELLLQQRSVESQKLKVKSGTVKSKREK